MKYCSMCGSEIPDNQDVCSMCYGDVAYGNDGYYANFMEGLEEPEQEQELEEDMRTEE